jgi:nucleotide-binding universal stress UspA family protein
LLKKILVALHDRETMGESLEKAAQLEHFTGAAVTVAQSCWDSVSEEPPQHFPQEEIDSITSRMKATELNNLSAGVAHYQERIAELNAKILWTKHHADAVARYALETSTDLIVAPRHDHSMLRRVVLPEELKLAAHARAPLLLTSAKAWPERVNVMAAVDVLADVHGPLNTRLLSFAQVLAGVLGGDLHLVNVDPASTSTAMPTQTLADYRKRSRETRSAALRALADTQPFEYAGLHVATGDIAAVLEELGHANNISITLVGTAARSGLGRLFVGNTAEALLHRLTDMDLVMIPHEPA